MSSLAGSRRPFPSVVHPEYPPVPQSEPHPSDPERRGSLPAGPRGWTRYLFPSLAALSVGGGSVYLLYRGGLPVVPDATAFRTMAWWTIPVYVALVFGVQLLRSVRWYWLLAPIKRVPLGRILNISFMFFAASVLLPFRMGELVRPSVLRQKEHVSWWAASGTVGAERIIDGLMLSVLLFFALQLATPLPDVPDRIGDLPVSVSVVPHAAYSALTLFAVAALAMGLFYWRRSGARELMVTLVGLVSRRAATFLTQALERIAEGLRFLPRARYSVPFLLLTLGYWLLHGFGIWLVIRGVGFDSFGIPEGYAVLGVFALGFLAPNVPGFFGTFQITIYAGLAMYLPPTEVVGRGAAVVFILYVVQIGVTLVGGLMATVLEYLSPPAPLPEGLGESA